MFSTDFDWPSMRNETARRGLFEHHQTLPRVKSRNNLIVRLFTKDNGHTQIYIAFHRLVIDYQVLQVYTRAVRPQRFVTKPNLRETRRKLLLTIPVLLPLTQRSKDAKARKRESVSRRCRSKRGKNGGNSP